MSVKKIKVDTLTYGPVSVWYDDDLEEYQVRVQGLRGSTYYMTDREDALALARLLESGQIVRNRQIVHNRQSREDAE